jgi:subtilase family serine protease
MLPRAGIATGLVVVLVAATLVGVPYTPTAPGPAPAGMRAPTLVTDAVPLPTGAAIEPIAPTTAIAVTFTLRFSNASELAALVAESQTPGSSRYGRFLAEPQFQARFAPPASAVAEVVRELKAVGARDLTVSPDRVGVGAVVPASGAESLLGVKFVSLPHSTDRPSYTTIGLPHLPASLSGIVSGVGGLSDVAGAPNFATMRVASTGSPTRPGLFVQSGVGSPVDWYFGSDYAQAYGAPALWPGFSSVANATFPTGVAVATLLAGGYNAAQATQVPPWDPAVVNGYFNQTFAAGWPRPTVAGVPVNVSGQPMPPLPPGPYGGLDDSTLDVYENSLDLEMAGSLAPGASLYNFYFNGEILTSGSVPLGDVADDFADDLGAALNHNYSPSHLAVVSCSFGLPDLNDSLWDAELVHAAALGVTVVAASGDQGNAPDFYTSRPDGQWPIWPASAAFNSSGALSVGGATVAVSGHATSVYNGLNLSLAYDPTDGAVVNSSAWYDTSGGIGAFAGTEGGASTVYPEPEWQFDSAAQWPIVNATELQRASSLGRSGPDLGFPANRTVVAVYNNTSSGTVYAVLEGTSVAAPVLGGLLADIVAVESNRSGRFSPLGYLDPALYRIASYYASFTGPPPASDPFLPVTNGSNYLFRATAGWDPLTGWGGLNASLFLTADENGAIRTYQYTGPTPGLPTNGSSTPTVPAYIYLLIGAVVAGVVAVIAVVAATARRPTIPQVPYGARPMVGMYPGPTFMCPYCGSVRPAEPIRCPGCGAF